MYRFPRTRKCPKHGTTYHMKRRLPLFQNLEYGKHCLDVRVCIDCVEEAKLIVNIWKKTFSAFWRKNSARKAFGAYRALYHNSRE